jgi:hypothetical protein
MLRAQRVGGGAGAVFGVYPCRGTRGLEAMFGGKGSAWLDSWGPSHPQYDICSALP